MEHFQLQSGYKLLTVINTWDYKDSVTNTVTLNLPKLTLLRDSVTVYHNVYRYR